MTNRHCGNIHKDGDCRGGQGRDGCLMEDGFVAAFIWQLWRLIHTNGEQLVESTCLLKQNAGKVRDNFEQDAVLAF